MLRSEAVARIQRLLGFRSDKEAEIIDALRDAQVALEEGTELPWFLRTEITSVSTVSGEERVKLPADFIREWDDDSLWYFNPTATEDADKWVHLRKEDLELLRRNSQLAGSGAPCAYAIDNDYFRIFPTPDAAYTLKMIYYGKDDVLSGNIENKWLKHLPFLLIGIAGQQVGTSFRDAGALSQFAKWETEGRRALLASTIERDLAGRELIIGGVD